MHRQRVSRRQAALGSGLLLALLLLLAWAPWMSRAAAEQALLRSFQARWEGVADGCGVACAGCGVVAAERRAFGYRVTLEYACGLLPRDAPEFHQKLSAFVTALGTVHGLPGP